MANYPGHREEAQRLAAVAQETVGEAGLSFANTMALAQVHATLALADRLEPRRAEGLPDLPPGHVYLMAVTTVEGMFIAPLGAEPYTQHSPVWAKVPDLGLGPALQGICRRCTRPLQREGGIWYSRRGDNEMGMSAYCPDGQPHQPTEVG